MGSKRSPFPDLTWLEFEVLSQLMWDDMYGNQILQVLEHRFGSDAVYSGKLYPTLQRLEKKGFVDRREPSGKDGVARGVDPVYYSLTTKGRRELEKTTMHTVVTFFERVLENLRTKIAERALELIAQKAEPPYRVGIALLGSEQKLSSDVRRMLGSMEDLEPVLIMVEGLCGKCTLCWTGASTGGSFMALKATLDDVPLKDGYLDVLVAVSLYRPGPEWPGFMEEAVRTVRKGGLVILVEFAKFNSYILEEIMNSMHKLGGARCDLEQVDMEMVRPTLEGMLKDIQSERMKEMLLVYGSKA